MTIRTVRPVPRDTPLTISYIDSNAPLHARRAHLASDYFFHCMCDRCTREETALANGPAALASGGRDRPKVTYERSFQGNRDKHGRNTRLKTVPVKTSAHPQQRPQENNTPTHNHNNHHGGSSPTRHGGRTSPTRRGSRGGRSPNRSAAQQRAPSPPSVHMTRSASSPDRPLSVDSRDSASHQQQRQSQPQHPLHYPHQHQQPHYPQRPLSAASAPPTITPPSQSPQAPPPLTQPSWLAPTFPYNPIHPQPSSGKPNAQQGRSRMPLGSPDVAEIRRKAQRGQPGSGGGGGGAGAGGKRGGGGRRYHTHNNTPRTGAASAAGAPSPQK
ncbi:hypothetical protein HDU90_003992 [Geranomyces variabilis]|nr:hypothetical protein HDU90_003992 [Geranomyces variabilis]